MKNDVKDDIFKDADMPPEKSGKVGFVNGNKLNADDYEELEQEETPIKKNGKVGFTVVLAIFLAVNILAILLFVFDVGNVRTKFVAFQTTALKNDAIETRLDAQQQALDQERKTIEEEKKRLEEKGVQLNEKDEQLNALKIELEQQQAKQASPSPNPEGQEKAASSDMQKPSITDAVKIYEGMDAKNAAKIIAALDMNQQVEIIKNIKKSSASEILSTMDPANSAKIMQEIMKD